MTSKPTHTNSTTPDEGCAVIGEVSECGPAAGRDAGKHTRETCDSPRTG